MMFDETCQTTASKALVSTSSPHASDYWRTRSAILYHLLVSQQIFKLVVSMHHLFRRNDKGDQSPADHYAVTVPLLI